MFDASVIHEQIWHFHAAGDADHLAAICHWAVQQIDELREEAHLPTLTPRELPARQHPEYEPLA